MSWWGQPDHFDWLSGYLSIHNMTRPVCLFFGCISMSFVLLPYDGFLRRGDFNDVVPVTIELTCAALGVIFAVVWFRGWPTKRQSAANGLVGSVTTVLWSFLQTDHMFGLLICATLTFSGAYFALFHSPPFTVLNLVLAATGAAVNAIALISGGYQTFHAILAVWIVMAMNTAATLAAQSFCKVLGPDLNASGLDPLTGLRNRRNLHSRLASVVQNARPGQRLRTTMVDLDDFKRLNDTRGHSTGDEALVHVARILRESAQDPAMVFRFGGEEFLLFEVVDGCMPSAYLERICGRVRDLPYGISASVGSVEVPLGQNTLPRPTIDVLIAQADVAMYQAKRQGGDQVVRQLL